MSISASRAKEKMRSMTPGEFEEFVAEVWSARGFTTVMRQQSRDRGIDFEARKNGTYTAVQVKRNGEENNIGSKIIRNYATLYQQDESIDTVVLVTSGGFTKPAEKLASDLDVTIVDGTYLAELAYEYGVPICTFSSISESLIANIEEISGLLGIQCNEYFVKAWAKQMDATYLDFFSTDIDITNEITSVGSEEDERDVVLTIKFSDNLEAAIRDRSIDLAINKALEQHFEHQQEESTASYILEYDLTIIRL